MLRRRRRLTARGRAGGRRGGGGGCPPAGGALRPSGAQAARSCRAGGRGRPLPRRREATEALRGGRSEARVSSPRAASFSSSETLFLLGAPFALSRRSGPSAAPHSGGSGALGSSAPAAGWLCLRAALSAPSAAPGWLGWRGSGRLGSSVRAPSERASERVRECARARRLPQGLPRPPPARPRRRLPAPRGPRLGSARLARPRRVPLRSGAPGSGLVTWPSRQPVALKKKAIVFRKQQIGLLKAASPPAAADATPSGSAEGAPRPGGGR